jgi:hypothetical protein
LISFSFNSFSFPVSVVNSAFLFSINVFIWLVVLSFPVVVVIVPVASMISGFFCTAGFSVSVDVHQLNIRPLLANNTVMISNFFIEFKEKIKILLRI